MSFLLPIVKGAASAAKGVAETAIDIGKSATNSIKVSSVSSVAKTAVDVAKTPTVQTALKITAVGGGVAAGGVLAGYGIQQAVVQPFQKLGLVTTNEKGQTTMTDTGKTVIIIGAVTLAAAVGFLYFVRK